MKKLFAYLFPDWEVVDVIQGHWEAPNKRVLSHVVYEILYSKNMGTYKLKLSGPLAKSHPNYKVAIKRLNQLQDELQTKSSSSTNT